MGCLSALIFIAAAAVASAADVPQVTLIPTVSIAPGVSLPMAGLGTWLYNDTVAEGRGRPS